MLSKCDYSALRLQSGKISEGERAEHEQRQGIDEKRHEGVGAAPVHDTAAPAGPSAPAHSVPSQSVPSTGVYQMTPVASP